jgi:hypothetical protein
MSGAWDYPTYVISSHGGSFNGSDYTPPRGVELIWYQPHDYSLIAPNAIQAQIGYQGWNGDGYKQKYNVHAIISNPDNNYGTRKKGQNREYGYYYSTTTYDYELNSDRFGSWSSGAVCYYTNEYGDKKREIIHNIQIGEPIMLSELVRKILRYHRNAGWAAHGNPAEIHILCCRTSNSGFNCTKELFIDGQSEYTGRNCPRYRGGRGLTKKMRKLNMRNTRKNSRK